MSVPQELLWLIEQLRNTPLPRERLRLLALGWRTLKDASAADRLYVARELGFEGAERLVEQLSRRGGASPARLLSALREAGDADPDRFREVVDGVLDPKSRAETVRRLAGEAAERLADDGVLDAAEVVGAVEAVAAPEPPPPRPQESEPLPQPGTDVDQPEGRPAAADPVLAGAPAAFSRDAARAIRDGSELDGSPVEVSVEDAGLPEDEATGIGAEPAADQTGASGVEPQLESEPSTPQVGTPAEVPHRYDDDIESAPEVAAPSLRTPAAVEVLSPLAGEMSVLKRLRVLSELVQGLNDIDVSQLQDVLGLFRAGWGRRRALETVFRAGLPKDLKHAVTGVDALQGTSQRLWALTTLVSSREIGDEDARVLIEATESDLIRRRLKSRLGCSMRRPRAGRSPLLGS